MKKNNIEQGETMQQQLNDYSKKVFYDWKCGEKLFKTKSKNLVGMIRMVVPSSGYCVCDNSNRMEAIIFDKKGQWLEEWSSENQLHIMVLQLTRTMHSIENCFFKQEVSNEQSI